MSFSTTNSTMNSGIIAQALGSIKSSTTNAATTNAATNGVNSNNDKSDKVAKQFEQMVLSQLLSYTDTDDDISDSMFGGGAGERAFKPFLYDQYAKDFTEKGGIGISAAVKSEILRIQEAAQK